MIALLILTLISLSVPTFSQEPGWAAGAATYYTGIHDVSGGYAGNCGFEDLSRNMAGINGAKYGNLFAAGSDLLYQGGANCGACYELKCVGNPVCTGKSIVVTITDFCPTKGNEQWCGADMHHFDLSGKAFNELVNTMAIGHFSLQYRRVPCVRVGPPVVSIEGNPYWQSLRVLNLAGGGTYNAMMIRSPGGQYVPLKRDWGTSFTHNGQIQAPISVKLLMSDPKTDLELIDCVPVGWLSGEYACHKNSSTVSTPESRRMTIQDNKQRLRCDCSCKAF